MIRSVQVLLSLILLTAVGNQDLPIWFGSVLQKMKSVLLVLGGGIGSSALMAFYGMRTGYFGTDKVDLCDSKITVHTASVRRGFLQDELTVWKNDRTDELLYAFEKPKANFHWSKATVHKFSSFKPFVVNITKYERADELDSKMKTAMTDAISKTKTSNLESQKLDAQIALLQVIKQF